MAYNLKQLRSQVRYHHFFLNGKTQNLWTADGLDAMPEELLTVVINEVGLEIQMALKADLEIKHNSLTEGSEVLAMPTNLLALKHIVIYDDTNDDDDDEATTAYAANEAEPLEMVSSYTSLVAPGNLFRTLQSGAIVGIPDVGGADVGDLFGPSGKPSKFMLHEQGGVLYALFDTIPDAAYFVDIYYWAIPADMAVDSDTPDIPAQYKSLFRPLSVAKVADFIGDTKRQQSAVLNYQQSLALMAEINSKRHTPSRVAFRLI